MASEKWIPQRIQRARIVIRCKREAEAVQGL